MGNMKGSIGAAQAAELKKAYVEGAESLKQIAERFGVSTRAVEKLSVKQQWFRARADHRTKEALARGDGQLRAIRDCAADALIGVKNALETATDVGDLYTIVRALKVTADIEFKTGGRLTPGEQARYDIELRRLEAENRRKSGDREVRIVWADEEMREMAE